jgi:hypothetical protein
MYAEKKMRHMETQQSMSSSSNPEPADLTQPVIHPLDHLAQAEQTFHDYQLQTGMDYLKSGYIPQTAAELQNLQTAEQETGQLQQSLTPSWDFMAETFANPQPDPYTNPLMQQQMMEDQMMQQKPTNPPDMMDPLMGGGGF